MTPRAEVGLAPRAEYRTPCESRTADVAVLGGGPAGTAAALRLARSGRSVVVLERSRSESGRVGETLPPEVRAPLTELGVWERFLADGPVPSPGIAVAWGDPEPFDHDFLLNPSGPGWHVDRRRFDATLAAAAVAAGADLLQAARLTRWDRAAAGVWLLEGNADGRAFDLTARFVIDAAGRAASPLRRLGGGRIVHDRLAGLVAFVGTNADLSGMDHRTSVEATENGWWYSALLPEGRHVAAFMTDADLLPRGGSSRLAFWHGLLRQAPLTRARVEGATVEGEPRVVAANCSRLHRVAGEGWLAAGDAAAALDPLSSQGVYRALLSGITAAGAVDDYLRGFPGSLKEYASDVESTFTADLEDWAIYYGRERRWRDAPFWRRRQSPPGDDLR